MNIQQIAIFSTVGPHLDLLYAAIDALDHETPPPADYEWHLRIDDQLTVDFSHLIDLADVARHPADSLVAAHDLFEVMAVLVLFEDATDQSLQTVQTLVAALRARAPHLPTYFAIPCQADRSDEDEIRLMCDMHFDDDPIYLYSDLGTATVRDLLVHVFDEVKRVQDDYATEANNILDVLLENE